MGQMKKILDVSKIKMCDVILTTSDAFISKKIRLYTNSDISHAMIYVDTHSIIDSTGNGVHAQSTQRLIWPEKCGVHVLRFQATLSEGQRRQISDFARQKIGTQYSTFEAGVTILGGRNTASRKQFCSRLVAQAYASAGIKLVDNPDYCTPAELLNSPFLEEILDITIPVSEEFEKTVTEIPDTTKVMALATNKLLEGARQRSASIQDVNDIDAHLMTHPEDDQYFASLYRESGYLDVWKFEYQKNPWQYDLDLMEQSEIPKETLIYYCEELVNDDGEGGRRYEVNLVGYYNYFAQSQLETFSILRELHKKLFGLYITRKEAANNWLSRHTSYNASSSIAWGLTPHTDEWFAALKESNAFQAEHVQNVIGLSGSSEVCSLCGDDPAEDYVLKQGKVPGVIDTLRLCKFCLSQRHILGETYVLLKQ